ncbi:MAG: hypothetical protein IJX14_07245 [Clostridia bacterium]|nr:hypothetical protein [Clostridia bacterium]
MKKFFIGLLLFITVTGMALGVSSAQNETIEFVYVSSYTAIPFDNMELNTMYVYPLGTVPENQTYSLQSNTNTQIDKIPTDSDYYTYDANSADYIFAGSCDSDETLYSKHYITGDTVYKIRVENLKILSSQQVECYNYNGACVFSEKISANSGMTGLVDVGYQRWYFLFPGSCNVEGYVRGS